MPSLQTSTSAAEFIARFNSGSITGSEVGLDYKTWFDEFVNNLRVHFGLFGQFGTTL